MTAQLQGKADDDDVGGQGPQVPQLHQGHHSVRVGPTGLDWPTAISLLPVTGTA